MKHIVTNKPEDCDLGDLNVDYEMSPVVECVASFMKDFSFGLSRAYIPSGDATSMCMAAMEFPRCIYAIPNIPYKHLMSGMVKMVTKINKDLCNDLPKGKIERLE